MKDWKKKIITRYCDCTEGQKSNMELHSVVCPVMQGCFMYPLDIIKDISSLLADFAKEMIDSQPDKIESHSPSFGSAIFSVDNSMKQELIKIAKKYGIEEMEENEQYNHDKRRTVKLE